MDELEKLDRAEITHLHEVVSALEALVRAEYPADLGIPEIARTWGLDAGLDVGQIDLLALHYEQPQD